MLEDGIIAEKKTQQKSRAETRVIFEPAARTLPIEIVKKQRHKTLEMSRSVRWKKIGFLVGGVDFSKKGVVVFFEGGW